MKDTLVLRYVISKLKLEYISGASWYIILILCSQISVFESLKLSEKIIPISCITILPLWFCAVIFQFSKLQLRVSDTYHKWNNSLLIQHYIFSSSLWYFAIRFQSFSQESLSDIMKKIIPYSYNLASLLFHLDTILTDFTFLNWESQTNNTKKIIPPNWSIESLG